MKPRPGDVAMDLQRCYEVSFSDDAFGGKTFRTFFDHALKDLRQIERQVGEKARTNVDRCLDNVCDESLDVTKRKESLLTASDILMNSQV